jgi:short-subunit dehydrogenase
MTKAFLPHMLKKTRRNKIIVIASSAGFNSIARMGDYGASKFAAVGKGNYNSLGFT